MAKNKKQIEYAAKYLKNTLKMDDEEILQELSITQNDLDKILQSDKKISKSKNLMIRETASKKQNTVSIMTEAASQLNDEITKKINSAKKQSTTDCIYRPNDK
jgi:hypothetical protein